MLEGLGEGEFTGGSEVGFGDGAGGELPGVGETWEIGLLPVGDAEEAGGLVGMGLAAGLRAMGGS